MRYLTVRLRDSSTNQPLTCRVQVLGPAGEPLAPEHAMWKVGPGRAFFYADSEFGLEVPRGRVQITVEHGTEYIPWRRTVQCEDGEPNTLIVELVRWVTPSLDGWHPGNTHVHYKDTEPEPDRRLRYDSRAEDLRVFMLSYVKRKDFLYASNKYVPGVLHEFTDNLHHVQMGAETRHNMGGEHAVSLKVLTDMGGPINRAEGGPHTYGFGHVLMMNVRNVIKPGSRGLLVDAFAADYPPISYACDDTHEQGGIVIWAHNGHGIECGVACILGKVDAISIWDTYWEDLEYDMWYRLLNCGIKMPAATGSDWFVCSANRVYARASTSFSYESWLEALVQGRTFITNGPILELTVNGKDIGDTVLTEPHATVSVQVKWNSHYPINELEVISSGNVQLKRTFEDGSHSGSLESAVTVAGDGWIAARVGSDTRDSFDQTIWAHTSPVYVSAGGVVTEERVQAAGWFVERIEESIAWLLASGKFDNDRQREEVVSLFRLAQQRYRELLP